MSYQVFISPPLTIKEDRLRNYSHSLGTQRLDKVVSSLHKLGLYPTIEHLDADGNYVSNYIEVGLPRTPERLSLAGVQAAFDALPVALREAITPQEYNLVDEYGVEAVLVVA